jgi:hypothetical protein
MSEINAGDDGSAIPPPADLDGDGIFDRWGLRFKMGVGVMALSGIVIGGIWVLSTTDEPTKTPVIPAGRQADASASPTAGLTPAVTRPTPTTSSSTPAIPRHRITINGRSFQPATPRASMTPVASAKPSVTTSPRPSSSPTHASASPSASPSAPPSTEPSTKPVP